MTIAIIHQQSRWLLLLFSIVVAGGIGLAVWYLWQPTFSGRLVDIAGSPASGIAVQSSRQTVVTDSNGNFTVRLAADDTAITVGNGEDAITVAVDTTTAQAQLDQVETSAPTITDLNEIFGDESGLDTSSLSDTERAALENEIIGGYYPGADDLGGADASDQTTNTAENTVEPVTAAPIITVPTLTVVPENLPPPVDPTSIVINEEGVEVVQGEIVVGWEADTLVEERTAAIIAAGGTLRFDDAAAQTSIIYVADQTQVPAVVTALQNTVGVTGALQNYLLEPDDNDFAPSDPDYSDEKKNWWLRRMSMEPAWQMSKGTNSTVVAVIDVGFATDHPDLAGAFTRTNLNFTTEALTTKARHGTHVSGIIAARQNNGEGLTGIAPHVRVLPIKIYDMARLPQVYQQLKQWPGVRIASMSMGWGWRKKNLQRTQAGQPPFTLAYMQQQANALDAVIRPSFLQYYQGGGVFCKSAGNDFGYDAKLNALNFDEVITVAAGMPQGGLTHFSNIGASIDIVAPGYKIWSPVDSPKMYDYLSGTSMATPAVCGTAALIRSLRPSYGPLLVKLIMQVGATEPTALSGTGYHYLDAWRALLRATKRFGITGVVADDDFNFVSSANVSTQPSAWSVVTNSEGDYVIPYLRRTVHTLTANKGDAKGAEVISSPPLNGDEILEMIFITLEGKTDDETNENVNEVTDDSNTSADSSDNANDNANDSSDSVDNTDTVDSNSNDSTANTSSTVLDNGIVVSAAGCAESGFTVPPAESDCAPGFYFSRETIACEQIQCPDGIGRTYTLECKCEGEGYQAIYACDTPGYMVACIKSNQ